LLVVIISLIGEKNININNNNNLYNKSIIVKIMMIVAKTPTTTK